MDCAQDLEFHMPDDSGRALEKAKESILLMKKKMFRSHDLILQYNNKLKECERLKEDLSLAQEEASKLKRENNLNLTKVVKLEMQSADNKKIRQELEQKIAERDIQIASDKSHLKQLECKLNDVEEKQVEKEMEAELSRSSLEVKTKELEQELKALKKSHLNDLNKVGRVLKSPKEKKGKKIIEVIKETREMGVNTVEELVQPKLVKPKTANKMVLTNEFYHIKDNPYPIFCDRCESLMEPKVEKICQIMSHPPLVSNILSPIRSHVPERQRPKHNDSKNHDLNSLNTIPNDLHRNESTRTEMNLSDTRRVELNYNENSRVDQFPRNFVSPLPSQLSASNNVQESHPISMDIAVPELDTLRRKIETLERKIKKQKIQKSSDSQPPNANCCTHQHPMNYFGHSSTHVNPVPNVFPNVQADLMTEFFNKMMNIANSRDLHQQPSKLSSRKKERTLRDKRSRNKLRKLKKLRMLKKKSSTNWEVESDDCDAANGTEKSFDPSDPTKPHLLRIKPTCASESSITLCSDTESEKLSPMKNSWAEEQMNSPENREKSPEKGNRIESDSNQESAAKIPDKRKLCTRGRKRGRASLFSDDGESEIEVEYVKNEVIEETQTKVPKNATRNTRTRSKSLRDDENERKSLSVKKIALEQQSGANSALQSTIKESDSLLAEKDARDPESCVLSQNSVINDSPSNMEEIDDVTQAFNKSAVVISDADQSDVPPDINCDSEPLESTNLKDRVEMQKRKRSTSPKAPKSTGRSNLLGKLRALKKNSVSTVAKPSNSPTVHTTRSLSRRKLTEQSDNDDFEAVTKEGKRAASLSGDETNVPMKKQRIAHVPKTAANFQSDTQEVPASSKTAELIDSSNEISKNIDEKEEDVNTTPLGKRPLTRRSAGEKVAQNKVKTVRETIKTGKVGRPRLVAATTTKTTTVTTTTTARRGRPPGKRNLTTNTQMSLDSKSKEIAPADLKSKEVAPADLKSKEVAPVDSNAESTENQVKAKNDTDTSLLVAKRDIDPKDLTKDSESSENSPQKIQIHASGEKQTGSPEKQEISELVTVGMAKPAEDSIVQSDRKEGSLTQTIHAAGVPINKMGITRALQVEKSSPAASLASLDGILVKPAAISILANQSAVIANAKSIENKESNENLPCAKSCISINAKSIENKESIENVPCAKSCISINAKSIENNESKENVPCAKSFISINGKSIENKESIENLPCAKSCISINAMDVSLALPLDEVNSKTSAQTLDDTAQNMDTFDELKNRTNEIIPSVPEESPASPNSTQNSPTKDIGISISSPTKREERLSIYDEVALSIPIEESANSTSINYYGACGKNATISNKFTTQDTLSDMPIEKPIERKLVVYDTNLDHDLDNEGEEFDSKNIVKPQFFVETSDVSEKKTRRHSGSSIESINVVKELRSRQVLCSPSTSANLQNLQKMQGTSNDDFKDDFPSEIRGSQTDSYAGVRSLGTLLNHHLGEQKKNRAVKNTKLRKAAAVKLQEVAEKSVKVELDKLVESEEWTSELHSSVIARLTDVRSERTIAKSIVDFLLERASLDEPLDRTYTPPAPVMTRTQQRIVTLMNCLNRVDNMTRIFDMVQAGIEYNVFKLGHVQTVETVQYLFRVFTVIARLRKDRERVRILCCDAFYFLGRRAIPAVHVILTVWPEVLPKHGTMASELPNCLAHIIKQENVGKDPFPKILALKKMITNYYEYPQIQPLSAVVMTVLMKALHERYSSDLEVAVILISKREGTQWALSNVIEKGLMKIIQDDSYQWQFEILNLLGFVLRSFSALDVDTSVKKFVDLLCQMLDSGEGSQDKQEGIVAALLSLSRYKTHFGRISDSVLKWMPGRELRATTLSQLDLFFKSHTPEWWNCRLQYKKKHILGASDKNN